MFVRDVFNADRELCRFLWLLSERESSKTGRKYECRNDSDLSDYFLFEH